MKGWVYIITNKAMPDLVKVGFSSKDPKIRAREFYNTGVPHRFVVEYEMLVNDPYKIEQKAHKILARYNENKEWFKCDINIAIEAIRQAAGNSTINESIKNKEKYEPLNAEEQFNLGNSYTKGEGVNQNLEKAFFWYTKSAEQGYRLAQHKLGNCYQFGWGGK